MGNSKIQGGNKKQKSSVLRTERILIKRKNAIIISSKHNLTAHVFCVRAGGTSKSGHAVELSSTEVMFPQADYKQAAFNNCNIADSNKKKKES